MASLKILGRFALCVCFCAISTLGAAAEGEAEGEASLVDSLVVDGDGDGEADRGDTIEYRVMIRSTGTAEANSVELMVPLNDALTLVPDSVMVGPIALDDSGNVNVLESVVIDVLSNDRDIDGTLLPTTVRIVEMPLSGTVSVDAGTGEITYTSTGAGGQDTFKYTVEDDDGLQSRESLVTVQVNDCPVAQDDDVATSESVPLNGDVFLDNGSGADSDAQGFYFVSEVNGAAGDVGASINLPSGALLTLNSNGSFMYDPNGVFDALDDGESDTETFTYTISDGICTDTSTVTVTINGANTCPTAVDDTFSVDQTNTVSGNVLNNNGGGADSDPEPGTTLAVTQVNGESSDVGSGVVLASGALLTLNGDGTFDYDPNGAFDELPAAGNDADSFTYTVSDGTCTGTGTVTIVINGENDCPVAQDDAGATGEKNVLNGNVLSDNGSGADADADTGHTLTITEVNGQAGDVGAQVTLTSGALLTLNGNGTFSYDPNDVFLALTTGEDDTDSFTYKVSDGTCDDTATVTITISGANDCPVAQDDGNATDEDSVLNGNLKSDNGSGADSDADTSDTTTVTEVNGSSGNVGGPITLASGALLTVNANGTFSYDPNGQFEGLTNGQDDTDTFTYTLSDGTCSDSATVTITINGVSDAPLAVAQSVNAFGNMELVGNTGGLDAAATASPSRAASVNLLSGASDADTATVDLSVVAATGTSTQGGNFEVFADGSFLYAPPVGLTSDTDTFTYAVTDGTTASSAATVTVTVGNLVWFINNTGGGSGGSGTSTDPFLSTADFNSANGGGAGKPAANQHIYLDAGGGNYTTGVTLLDGQVLEGEGVALVLDTVTLATAGTAPTITSTTNDGVTLGSGNTLRGFNIANTPGFQKIRGAAAGNLTVGNVALTGTGGAIEITTSAAFGSNVNFSTLESTSSPGAAISLTGVTGTLGIASPGSGISGTAAASSAIAINGGSVSLTYTGGVTKANAGALVSVSGGHNSGTITFTTTGLAASDGTGLQFDNADGTYTFSSVVTLNGGDAGIDITNGSDGNFTFSDAPVTNPVGAALLVSGGSGTIVHAGAISKSSTGRLIDIQSRSGGSISVSGNLSSTTLATGILLQSNSGGTVAFSGATKTISTTADAITLANCTGSATNFTNGGLTITTSSGKGLAAVSAGSLTVSGAGNSVNAFAGPALDIDDATLVGTFTTLTSTSSTTQGLDLTNLLANSSLTVTGATTVSASTAIGINIDDVEAGSVFSFAGLGVTNRGSHGIFVRDFDGTSLSAGDADITNGLAAGGNGVHVQSSSGAISFASLDISGTNATVNRADAGGDGIADNETDDGHGVRLVDCIGSFSVSGAGPQGDGGTIQNIEGDGFSLIRSGGLNLDEMTINNIGTSNQAAASVDNAGIFAVDLIGTNVIGNSTISRFQDGSVGGGSSRGVSITNSGVSFTSFTSTDTSYFNDNSLLGDDAIQVVTNGTVNGALNVNSAFNLGNISNNSEFFQVSGHGVQVVQNGGGTLTTSISDTTFRDTISVGGFGGIDLASAGSGIMSNTVDECLFLALYPGGVNNSGVITFFASGTVDFDGTVNNCTFGSASQRTSDGRGAIRASTDTSLSAAVADFDITISNNTIDDTDREAISIFPRGAAVPLAGGAAMDIVITGNDIGQTTAVANDSGLGREGIEFVSTENAKLINLTIENNAIRNFVDSSSDESLDIKVNDNTSATVTVRGNTFNQSGAAGTADSVDISSNTTGTLCLDMNSANTSSNTCPHGIVITETAGTYSIEDIGGASIPAATVKAFIEARNSGTAVVTGTFDSCNLH